jgi:arylsulfatase
MLKPIYTWDNFSLAPRQAHTILDQLDRLSIVDKLKSGYWANGKEWKVRLDGYDFTPFFKGEADKSPRETIYYFSQSGELNAVRWNDWKVHFGLIEGNIATGVREVPGWPAIYNLKADPYEEMTFRESLLSARWYADNMWLFVPVQAKVKEFLGSLQGYPFQPGSSLSAAGHQLSLAQGDEDSEGNGKPGISAQSIIIGSPG